jgi:hypothetical protein
MNISKDNNKKENNYGFKELTSCPSCGQIHSIIKYCECGYDKPKMSYDDKVALTLLAQYGL